MCRITTAVDAASVASCEVDATCCRQVDAKITTRRTSEDGLTTEMISCTERNGKVTAIKEEEEKELQNAFQLHNELASLGTAVCSREDQLKD